jgi:hypothetical protein
MLYFISINTFGIDWYFQHRGGISKVLINTLTPRWYSAGINTFIKCRFQKNWLLDTNTKKIRQNIFKVENPTFSYFCLFCLFFMIFLNFLVPSWYYTGPVLKYYKKASIVTLVLSKVLIDTNFLMKVSIDTDNSAKTMKNGKKWTKKQKFSTFKYKFWQIFLVTVSSIDIFLYQYSFKVSMVSTDTCLIPPWYQKYWSIPK